MLVLDETFVRFSQSATLTDQQRAQNIIDYPAYASLGAIGPDLLYYKETSPKLVAVLPRIFDWLNQVAGILGEGATLAADIGAPNIAQRIGQFADGVNAGMIQLETELTSFLVEVASIIGGDLMQPAAIQNDEPEVNWKWGDLLHWRLTGDLAYILQEEAARLGRSDFAIYADAYWSHLATDYVGHPYVNQTVGGPGRSWTNRHHLCENFLDTFAFAHVGKDINISSLDERFTSLKDDTVALNEFSQFLSDCIRKALEFQSPDFPILPAIPTPDEIAGAVSTMCALFRYVTRNNSIPQPKRPGVFIPPLPGQTGSLLNRFTSVLPPPGAKFSLKDFLKALLFLAGFVPVLIADLTRFIADIVAGLVTYPIAVALYYVQLALHELYRATRWFLVVHGVVFPLNEELQSSLANEFIVITEQTDGPYAKYPHRQEKANGFIEDWYIEGRQFHVTGVDSNSLYYPTTEIESPNARASPYRPGATPNYFIREALANPTFITAWENAANPMELLHAIGAHIPSTLEAPCGFGNAIDLWIDMLDHRDRYRKINLDADREYGAKRWTCDGGFAMGNIQNERFI